MNSQLINILLGSIGMIFFTAGLLYVTLVVPEKRLQQWAARRRLVVLTSDPETYSDHPLQEGTGQYQALFKVRVRTESGDIRTGHVRLGSARVGLASEYAEEFWDDAKPA